MLTLYGSPPHILLQDLFIFTEVSGTFNDGEKPIKSTPVNKNDNFAGEKLSMDGAIYRRLEISTGR